MKEYIICRKVISKEISNFLFDYFKAKRKVAKLLIENNILSKLDEDYGTLGDSQAPNKNTYCLYADIAFETLLTKLKPYMEKKLKMKLIETYVYGRIYTTGDVLETHSDRENCAHSITLNLGGDPWPFYIEDENGDTIKIIMKPGDAVIYKGDKYRHWREKFTGKECGQIFLHYIKEGETNPNAAPYDFRPCLGLTKDQSIYVIDQLRKRQNENN